MTMTNRCDRDRAMAKHTIVLLIDYIHVTIQIKSVAFSIGVNHIWPWTNNDAYREICKHTSSLTQIPARTSLNLSHLSVKNVLNCCGYNAFRFTHICFLMMNLLMMNLFCCLINLNYDDWHASLKLCTHLLWLRNPGSWTF